MIYCVDTSSLIAAWQERYPIENFPKFWDRMDALIKDGRLISPIEVFNEIKKRSDELHGWLKSRKEDMFRELDDDVQIEVTNVLKQFPRLVADKKLRTSADPFVIAPRANYRASVGNRGEANRQSQPAQYSRCAQLSLSTIGILQVIQREKWVAG
ncbi:MAG: DUF4411 family protein [Terracidiphilus sp.]